MQGATVLFTAELLLPSGKRIELIGYAADLNQTVV